MTYIEFNYENTLHFIDETELDLFQSPIEEIHHTLHNEKIRSNPLGWLTLQNCPIELERIRMAAMKIQQDSDVLLVIGIGGSYLGTRAAIEMLHHSFGNLLPGSKQKTPHIIFVGQHISAVYKYELLSVLHNKDVSINVVSKSGTTTEPAIAFRIFRKFIEEKYGEAEASKRIYVTTDKEKGVLKKLSDTKGYETFIIPDDIGGRYSVLTPVGLLPMAVGGIAIDDVLMGAIDATKRLQTPKLSLNPAYQYAAIRNILYNKGYMIEILATYEPKLISLSDWWVQLFGESEGKDGKGIFPATAQFSTDLHSFGQYIQDGPRKLFETIIKVKSCAVEVMIENDLNNMDGLNYLAGKSLHDINTKACEASIIAHTEGGVPNIAINIPAIDAYTFGYIVYFFQKACAMSSYLLGVNPFDQPGVESYKRNMYRLLGKPGYDREKSKSKVAVEEFVKFS